MNSNIKERRKKTRIEFNTEVILKIESHEVTLHTDLRDISINGLYVKTDKEIEAGTFCDIQVILSGSTSKLSVNIKGKIVSLFR